MNGALYILTSKPTFFFSEDKTGFTNWEILSSFDMDKLHLELKSHLDNAQRHCTLDAHHRWTLDNTFRNRFVFLTEIYPTSTFREIPSQRPKCSRPKAICPRSLIHFYLVSHYLKIVLSSWTYSSGNLLTDTYLTS